MFRGVGQGIRPCRIGYAGKFSSVFICGPCLWFLPFFQSRSPEVKVSRSGRPNADHISLAAGRKAAAGRLDASTPSTCRPAKSKEQSENVYENKRQVQEVSESRSADRRFCGLRLFDGCWIWPRTANTAVRATPARLQNRGNKARMYMKTKNKYKKSLGQLHGRSLTHFAPAWHLRFQSLRKMRFLYSQKQSSQSMPQTTRLVTIAA